jgi:hypothetical protein
VHLRASSEGVEVPNVLVRGGPDDEVRQRLRDDPREISIKKPIVRLADDRLTFRRGSRWPLGLCVRGRFVTNKERQTFWEWPPTIRANA